MSDKMKNIFTTVIFLALIIGIMIVNILKTSDLSNERIMKKFYNIEMSCV